jgi:hypothetical protein
MEMQALEVLEERVNRAVALVAELKADKKGLELENMSQREEIGTLTGKIKSLEEKGERLQALEAENQGIRQAQAEVKRRLEDIIAKLEKFKE